MDGTPKKSPTEVVTERIITAITDQKTLIGPKRLNDFKKFFLAGQLSVSEAESLFEFDRQATVEKK